MSLIALVSLADSVSPNLALAYIGPGLGLATIGLILGLIFSVFLAVIGLFWYPIKRLFGKGRKSRRRAGTLAGGDQSIRNDRSTDR